MTAGHCVARASPRQVHVTLGDYVINSAVEPLPAYTFGVSSIQVFVFNNPFCYFVVLFSLGPKGK